MFWKVHTYVLTFLFSYVCVNVSHLPHDSVIVWRVTMCQHPSPEWSVTPQNVILIEANHFMPQVRVFVLTICHGTNVFLVWGISILVVVQVNCVKKFKAVYIFCLKVWSKKCRATFSPMKSKIKVVTHGSSMHGYWTVSHQFSHNSHTEPMQF